MTGSHATVGMGRCSQVVRLTLSLISSDFRTGEALGPARKGDNIRRTDIVASFRIDASLSLSRMFLTVTAMQVSFGA